MADMFEPYEREAALSMEFAYEAFIEDVERELASAHTAAVPPLKRLLAKVRDRRSAIRHIAAMAQHSPRTPSCS